MKNKLRVISALLCAVLIFADIGSFRGEAVSFVPTAVDAQGYKAVFRMRLYGEYGQRRCHS